MKPYLRTMACVIAGILLTCLLFAFLILWKFYISATVILALLFFEVYYLFRRIEKNSSTLKQFIWSVAYADFQTSYAFSGSQKDISPELADAMEKAIDNYKQQLQDKEGQMQYFQALADHIDLAVLVFTAEGIIEWTNRAARFQLGLRSLHILDDLATFHPDLPARLRTLRPGDTSILQVERERETFQMVLSGISFVVMGKSLTVVSMKNIRSVLEDKETEAWQKLISVLTHEIMNSMTPIASLAELLEMKFTPDTELSPEEQEELGHAVATIGKRSRGLIKFVENYRKVTGIPAPVMQLVSVNSLLADVVKLFDTKKADLLLCIPEAQLRVIADRNQIEQVLINLIKNACEATKDCEKPVVEISAGINANGYTYIKVSDNGTGIPAQVLERIFIPFFTTKSSGSGLGLSISRQVMHMHRGSLTANSEEGLGSTFTLTFRAMEN